MPEKGPLIAQVIRVCRRVDFSEFPRLVKKPLKPAFL